MTENTAPDIRPFLPKVPANLAEAYLAASGLDATIKMIQEQVAVTMRGPAIADSIIAQHSSWAKTLAEMVKTAQAQIDFSGLAATVELARASVATQVDLSGLGTLTTTISPSLREVIEEARQARETFAGTELESDLDSLLSDQDRTAIDEQVGVLRLDDDDMKAVLSWYLGIVVAMLYVVALLGMSDAVERYSTVLEIVGLPNTVVVTKTTAKAARKILDAQFPTSDDKE